MMSEKWRNKINKHDNPWPLVVPTEAIRKLSNARYTGQKRCSTSRASLPCSSSRNISFMLNTSPCIFRLSRSDWLNQALGHLYLFWYFIDSHWSYLQGNHLKRLGKDVGVISFPNKDRLWETSEVSADAIWLLRLAAHFKSLESLERFQVS